MSRERKRKRDERLSRGRSLYPPFHAANLDILEWSFNGATLETDPVTGIERPVNKVVMGSHVPTEVTPIPTDRN